MPTQLPCLARPVAPAATLKKLSQSAHPRRHQLILVMKADGIELLHWVRGWRGWALQRAVQQPWETGVEKSESLAGTLRAVLASWPVPAGTSVALVLRATAGELALLSDSTAEFAAAMPFPPVETVHVALPLAAADGPRGLFWLHRDSVEEYVDLLGAHGLRLADIFARAQVAAGYLTSAELRTSAAVIEEDGDDLLLHLYLPGGAPFRSARLPASETHVQRAGRVEAELASAGAYGQAVNTLCIATAMPNEFSAALNVAVIVRAAQPLSLLAGRLCFSSCEGIWLPPPRADLLAGFNRWAIGIAVAGLVLFVAMLWQTDRYEKAAGENGAAVKKLKSVYDRAAQLEREAILSSETVRGVGDIDRLPRPLDPLARLAEQFPVGVWLTEFTYRQGNLRLAGYAPDIAAVREYILRQPGFQVLRTADPPPPREGAGEPFALEGLWQQLPADGAGAEGRGA